MLWIYISIIYCYHIIPHLLTQCMAFLNDILLNITWEFHLVHSFDVSRSVQMGHNSFASSIDITSHLIFILILWFALNMNTKMHVCICEGLLIIFPNWPRTHNHPLRCLIGRESLVCDWSKTQVLLQNLKQKSSNTIGSQINWNDKMQGNI